MATPGQTIVASARHLSEKVAEPYLKSTAESPACPTDARVVEEAATRTTPPSIKSTLHSPPMSMKRIGNPFT